MDAIERGQFDLSSGDVKWRRERIDPEGPKRLFIQATAFLSRYIADKDVRANYIWLERDRRRPAIKIDKRNVFQVNTTGFRTNKVAHSVMLCPNKDKAKKKPYHVEVGRKLIYKDVSHFVVLLIDEDQKQILLRFPEITEEEYYTISIAEIYILSFEQVFDFFKGRQKNKAIHQGIWRKKEYLFHKWLEGSKGEEEREGF